MNDLPQELPQSPTLSPTEEVSPIQAQNNTLSSENDKKEEEEKELTLKQRKWIDKYLETGNATEAAMQVYDCKNRDVAKSIGHENLTKLDYTDFMEAAGVTDKLLQEKLLEGLDSTKTVSARPIKGRASPTPQELPDANSLTDDFIDVPDFMVRHKYLETALKLKRRLTEKIDLTSGGKVIKGPILYIPQEKKDVV
jgi:hypothetical protein